MRNNKCSLRCLCSLALRKQESLLPSSLRAHKHGDTGKDPLADNALLTFHHEISCGHKGRTTRGGDIDGAFVGTDSLPFGSENGGDVDDGHLGMEIL